MRDKRDTAAGRLFAMPFAGGFLSHPAAFFAAFLGFAKRAKAACRGYPPPAAFLFWGIRKVRDACRRSAQILRYSPF